jgi:hypothetical protein
MISEKVFKSSTWIAHMHLVKAAFRCDGFTIAIFVPTRLQAVAERIAQYANKTLIGTIFRVTILVPPSIVEQKIFKRSARNVELCNNRIRKFRSAGEAAESYRLGQSSVELLYSTENEEPSAGVLCWLWELNGMIEV